MIETSRDLVIEQLARLRFACSAMGLEPSAIRLGDLDPAIATNFRKLAQQDFHDLVAAGAADKPKKG